MKSYIGLYLYLHLHKPDDQRLHDIIPLFGVKGTLAPNGCKW